MNKLKPCPFCGSSAGMQEAIDKKGRYHVVCNDRKCKCPMIAGMPIWRDTKEQTAEDWNRRANQNE